MAASILVAYATKYGSTAEVAEAVGKRLRERGLNADVRRARDTRSLDAYDAVVFASPLYIGSLLKDGVAFLEKHRSELERMPVAVFALGPTSAEEGLDDARGQLDEALAKLPWLQPVAREVFVGKYDPAHLDFCDKILTKLPATPLHDLPANDGRDWAAIDAWADTLPEALAGTVPARG